ncbi:hypothetical protein WA158_003581 [Blastocystis sp. Blastoise]
MQQRFPNRYATSETSKENPANQSNGEQKIHRGWILNDFFIGKCLGEGQYGKVYKVKEKESGKVVAMKIMYIERFYKDGIIDQLAREINIQSKLHHPNILRVYGAFIQDARVHVVMEWANRGTLYNYFFVQDDRRFSEPIVAYLSSQVLAALIYCHKFGIMHRDLKPENVLMTSTTGSSDVVVKLGDFGWSICQNERINGMKKKRRTTYCGTIDYMAPELGNRGKYDMRAEAWSFGVLIYELLTGVADENNPSDPLFMMFRDGEELPFPEPVSPEAQDIIYKSSRYA